MMSTKSLTAADIAELLDGVVHGDPQASITDLASIHEAGPDQLTFAVNEKRIAELQASNASIAIVDQEGAEAPMTLILVDNVLAAMSTLLEQLASDEDAPPTGIHPSALVDPEASIATDVSIASGVVVGAKAKIGAGCVLCANVIIGTGVVLGQQVVVSAGTFVGRDCLIGNRVKIGPNSVIGSEGFGYYTTEGVHHRIPHIGNVIIEDDVEIGACTCVDRAKFGSTVIGAGTKIDNLVQVAHNVHIGRGCILAGQAGVAGSTQLGNYVVLGGSVGVRDNITLGDGVQCAAFSAVAENIEAGQIVAGIPAVPIRNALRSLKAANRLPELLKRVKSLESRLEEIESSENH